jgi:uncharacterized protein (DUF2252 family)
MAIRKIAHASVDDREARGLTARDRAGLSSHAGWRPAADRPDPVALLAQQDAARERDLVPVRHGRMAVSPFTFYRGAARVMAEDLKDTPVAGLEVQLCGDAHLSNFGLFASPERTLLFDVNDFDETLPGPFEYDVERMAASFTVAARGNGFGPADVRTATLASVRAYRTAMASFAQMGTMDIWYARLDEDELMAAIRAAVAGTASQVQSARKAEQAGQEKAGQEKAAQEREKGSKQAEKIAEKTAEKAHASDSLQALSKLTELVDGQYQITSQPPLIVPARDLVSTFGLTQGQLMPALHEQFRAYRATLQDDRRRLLERFEVVDMARKVVGVGSVGTRCYIVLLQGRDSRDPLFLQVKQATASVLEANLRRSRYRQHGERVVQGQRLMQAASDIYLGWTRGLGPDERRHFYWRQLRDMKGSVEIDKLRPVGLTLYAGICGWTLARAHARSGDPVAIGAYLGDSDAFDQSITDFSERYADQNERDHAEFVTAIREGRLEAVTGV